MLIALEGMDGVGKTTVANEITKVIANPVDILHSGPTNKDTDVLDEYVNRLMFYRPGVGLDVVLDRWHLGEAIYGPIYRGGSRMDEVQQRYIDLVLDKLGAAKAVMNTPLETVRMRLGARGDELLRSEHVAKVHRAYSETALFARWPVVNTTHLSAEALATHLRDTAATKEIHARRLVDFPNYVGSTFARVLLVGDERNPSRRDELPHQLAFPPYRGSSGHFLIGALIQGRVDVEDVGITNANDKDDVRRLYDLLRRPKVTVALGINASKKLTALGIPHYAVEHPQYVRRFRNKQQKAYGLLIRDMTLDRPEIKPALRKV